MKNTVVVKVVDVTVALLLAIESFVVISVSMGYGLAGGGGGVELLVFIPLKKRKSNISSHAENNRSLLYTL